MSTYVWLMLNPPLLTSSQLGSLTKILRCAKDNDVVTIKASDDADSLTLLFESPSESPSPTSQLLANPTQTLTGSANTT